MKNLYATILATIPLFACDMPNKVTFIHPTQDVIILASNAATNLSIIKRKSTGDIICIKPAPDALSGDSLSLSGSSSKISEGTSSATSEAELIGRTPVVIMMRDSQFNLCNLYQNGVIDESTYLTLFKKNIGLYANLMSEEIKTTTVAITEVSEKSSMQSAPVVPENSPTVTPTVTPTTCPAGQTTQPDGTCF
jgi:hypothetical protein